MESGLRVPIPATLPKKFQVLRVLKNILGALCLLIGLFALVTPLTPGAWLIIVGLELLGLGFLIPKRLREYGKKLMDWLKRKKKIR